MTEVTFDLLPPRLCSFAVSVNRTTFLPLTHLRSSLAPLSLFLCPLSLLALWVLPLKNLLSHQLSFIFLPTSLLSSSQGRRQVWHTVGIQARLLWMGEVKAVLKWFLSQGNLAALSQIICKGLIRFMNWFHKISALFSYRLPSLFIQPINTFWAFIVYKQNKIKYQPAMEWGWEE